MRHRLGSLAADTRERKNEIGIINSQSRVILGNVSQYINKAINQKLIPEENLNTEDLTAIGNYLVNGEEPMMTTPVGNTVVNKELKNVAIAIWKLVEEDRKKEQLQKAVQQRDAPKKDNTVNNASNAQIE